MAEQFITCIFKFHSPSKRKRQILDHVFEQYTLGMHELLGWCHNNLDLLRDEGRKVKGDQATDRYDEKKILKLLPRSSRVQLPIASCLKESLLDNVASMITSYLALEKLDSNTGYPTARDPSPQGWANTLDDFALVGGDLEDENAGRHRLLQQVKGSVMPVQYARSRDFILLSDPNQTKFFAWLKLLPAGHPWGQPLKKSSFTLVNMNTGEVFKKERAKSGLLLPLSLGRRNGDWHWQHRYFLSPLKEGKAKVKAAKVVRKGNGTEADYFLHVSFVFDCPDPYEPRSYLGIDRGVFFSMAYGLVDAEGSVIEMGHKKDGFRHTRIAAGQRVQKRQARGKAVTVRDYRQKHLDSILYAQINDMVTLALKHQAMIVLEDLNIQIRGKFYKSAWRKMHKFLDYKCRLAGVPVWGGGIWAAYSSQICIYCGELNPHRKRDGSPFTCLNCGAQYHSDEGAGVNIARRALYRKKDWEKLGGYRAFHRSFANGRHFEAKNDLRKEGVPVT